MAHIREIINSRDISMRFILGVLGFFKTTRSFPKIPEDVRSLSKAKLSRKLLSTKSEYCHLFTLHMVFVPYMGLS